MNRVFQKTNFIVVIFIRGNGFNTCPDRPAWYVLIMQALALSHYS